MITNTWITGNQDLTLPLSIQKEIFGSAGDAYDSGAMYLVLFDDEIPCAVGRIYHNGSCFVIDKIGVKEAFRRQAVGDLLIRLLLYKAFTFANQVAIECPAHLEQVFAKFGFERQSETPDHMVSMALLKDNLVFASHCGDCKKAADILPQ